jgi:hypothetical protein
MGPKKNKQKGGKSSKIMEGGRKERKIVERGRKGGHSAGP